MAGKGKHSSVTAAQIEQVNFQASSSQHRANANMTASPTAQVASSTIKSPKQLSNLKKLTFADDPAIIRMEPSIGISAEGMPKYENKVKTEKGIKKVQKVKMSAASTSKADSINADGEVRQAQKKQKLPLFGQVPAALPKSPKPAKDVTKEGSFGVKIRTLLKDKSKSTTRPKAQNLAVVVYDGNQYGPKLYIKPGVLPPVTPIPPEISGVPVLGMEKRRHTSGPSALGKIFTRQKQGSLSGTKQRQFSDDLSDTLYVYQKRERFNSLLSGHESAQSGQYEYMIKDKNKAIVQFMKMHACYDAMPMNSKLVVLDTRLSVKHAFNILSDNRLRVATLWNKEKHKVTGILTVTDFINVLLKRYDSIDMSTENIQGEFIANWRLDLTDMGLVKPLIHISPEKSLYEALSLLFYHKINRLPVIAPDTGNLLHILTMKRILKFLFLHRHSLPKVPFFNQTIGELQIGTFDLHCAREDDRVYAALRQFVEHKISALPVVSADGECVGLYAKYDVLNLAGQNLYHDLNITIREALRIPNRHQSQRSIYQCHLEDKLHTALERIHKFDIHRLIICTPDTGKLLGMLSLSDIWQCMVMKYDKITEITDAAMAEETADKLQL